jgi:hypothetical protein
MIGKSNLLGSLNSTGGSKYQMLRVVRMSVKNMREKGGPHQVRRGVGRARERRDTIDIVDGRGVFPALDYHTWA